MFQRLLLEYSFFLYFAELPHQRTVFCSFFINFQLITPFLMFLVHKLKLHVLQSCPKETSCAVCWGSKTTCFWSWCFTCQFLQCSGEEISHLSWSEGIKLLELFFLYLSMILLYPLVSVSHLAVLYPPLLCEFPFPEVTSSRKCWVPLCWASSVLISGKSEAQLTSCTGYIKVLKFLFLK